MQTCPRCQASLDPGVPRCPHCGAEIRPMAGQRRVTMKERVVKPTILESVAGSPVAARPVTRREERPPESTSPQKPNKDDAAQRYRPIARPSIAMLCLMDDDSKEGEWIRVRVPEVTLGRVEADILIPHDDQISGTHAQLSRRFQDNRFHWFLRDLNSTNGTFLKVSKAKLHNSLEILIGCHRYRFDSSLPEIEPEPSQQPQGTRGWRAVSPTDLKSVMPSLVRLTPDGDGIKLSCSQPELLVGSDPSRSTLFIADDPMVSSVHAKLWRDPTGNWFLQDEGSLNGIWVAITEKRIDTDAAFQIGEQRIVIRLP